MSTTTASRILDGTAEAIGSHGIAETTVQHILDASHVSRRTFYKHYTSKEDALRGLYARYADTLVRATATEIGKANDPLAQVERIIGAYISTLEQGGPVMWRLVAEAVGSDSMLAADREQTLDVLVETIDKAVRSLLGMRTDLLVYRALLLALEGLALHQHRSGTIDLTRLAAVTVPMFQHVIAAGRAFPQRDPRA